MGFLHCNRINIYSSSKTGDCQIVISYLYADNLSMYYYTVYYEKYLPMYIVHIHVLVLNIGQRIRRINRLTFGAYPGMQFLWTVGPSHKHESKRASTNP